jgi:hypothetical protein
VRLLESPDGFGVVGHRVVHGAGVQGVQHGAARVTDPGGDVARPGEDGERLGVVAHRFVPGGQVVERHVRGAEVPAAGRQLVRAPRLGDGRGELARHAVQAAQPQGHGGLRPLVPEALGERARLLVARTRLAQAAEGALGVRHGGERAHAGGVRAEPLRERERLGGVPPSARRIDRAEGVGEVGECRHPRRARRTRDAALECVHAGRVGRADLRAVLRPGAPGR